MMTTSDTVHATATDDTKLVTDPDPVQARLDEAQQRRSNRYASFKKFFEESPSLIRDISSQYDDLVFFQHLYSFYVTPGGAMGGQNPRSVEVFFGQRPFESQKSGAGLMFHAESGARLHYERLDSGAVQCILIPAHTRNTRPDEKLIFLEMIQNPEKLRRSSTLLRHLRYLVAYMAMTSLDGAPTWSQKVRYYLLYAFKPYVIKRRVRFARIYTESYRIGRWVLTIALSGCAIFLGQLIWPSKDNTTPAIATADANARAGTESIRLAITEMGDRTDANASEQTAALTRIAEQLEAILARADQDGHGVTDAAQPDPAADPPGDRQ